MLRQALYLCGSLALLGNSVRAQVNDGYVGVYEDSLGIQPCAAILPFHGATLYVLATLSGATASGITGAEFRIEVSLTRQAGFSPTLQLRVQA